MRRIAKGAGNQQSCCCVPMILDGCKCSMQRLDAHLLEWRGCIRGEGGLRLAEVRGAQYARRSVHLHSRKKVPASAGFWHLSCKNMCTQLQRMWPCHPRAQGARAAADDRLHIVQRLQRRKGPLHRRLPLEHLRSTEQGTSLSILQAQQAQVLVQLLPTRMPHAGLIENTR
jgi:hypothetical protein